MPATDASPPLTDRQASALREARMTTTATDTPPLPEDTAAGSAWAAGRSLRRWLLVAAVGGFFLPPLIHGGEVTPCRAIASIMLRHAPIGTISPAFVQRVAERELAAEWPSLPAPVACTVGWWRMATKGNVWR